MRRLSVAVSGPVTSHIQSQFSEAVMLANECTLHSYEYPNLHETSNNNMVSFFLNDERAIFI